MNKTVTIESRNHKYANTYGGEIFASDYCTDYEGTRNIASRIATDFKFDELCKKNIMSRKDGYRKEGITKWQ